MRSAFSVLFAAVLAAAVFAACSAPVAEPAGPPAPPVEEDEGPWRVVEASDGLFGRLEVLEHRGSLALAADGVFQTVFPASPIGIPKGMLLRGGDHAELVPYFRPSARTALLIGLGGGLEARCFALHGIEVTAVEIDPEVVRLARKHFAVSCETVVADGRAFLDGDPRRFDAIVLDAFAGADLPEKLFTREAFEAAERRLEPDGVLAVHLIGRPGHPALRAVARTLAAVFPHAAATRAGIAGELQAIWLFSSAAPLDLGPAARLELDRLGFEGREFFAVDAGASPVLTDARSGLADLARDIAEEHRRLSIQIRRNPPW